MNAATRARLALLQGAFAALALPAAAQVVPAEPFGGRPFGSDAVREPAPAPQPVVPVLPGGVMVQPGAVLVQPVPVQVPQQLPQQLPQQVPQQAAPQVLPQQAVPQQGVPQAPAMQAPTPAMQAPTPAMQAPPSTARQAAPRPPPPPQAPTSTAAPGARSAMTPPFQDTPGTQRGPAPAAAPPPPVQGLPPDAPPLVVSGAVWSADPRQRRLLVNGVPLAEGADAGGGVVVREIGPERAVLEFRGQRHAVAW
jgi:general secretion pathway protein B